MLFSSTNLLLIVYLLQGAAARPRRLTARGPDPSLPSDPNTSQYCSWWLDLDTATDCSALLKENFLTLEEFRRWNPSISAGCDNLVVGQSYCVEALSEPPPGPASSSQPSTSSSRPTTSSTPITSKTSSSSSSTRPAPVTTAPTTTQAPSSTTLRPSTTTTPGNGISTPSPLQPSIVDNCDEFYFVKLNEQCDAIAKAHGITLAQFLTWNPKAGATCTGLWAEAYACVSVIGVSPSLSSSAAPSTTTPGNGIATPAPIQANMVKNCDSFYLVKGGDTCYDIGKAQRVSSAEIISWNPAVGSGCGSLWPDYYICISIVGHEPTPSWIDPVAPALPSKSFDTGVYPPRAARRFTSFKGTKVALAK
ncbi:hypothetical protein BU23DRAFT_533807 [Bimuria novae-zelandiae CBS 107.79]|uniref:LysM domain-containing protein n=1 Tax=Bimuria novae-zelandiae CBS 107.79 TaxID=1447943 RepID=A0A6A5VB68_9PLEO|nr:hypothetical protein BU23DRAFT_533807 [Bimuria novae-zelandiae CBS 107.79]